jgi:nicotinate-nucleotide adenylyltransferase
MNVGVFGGTFDPIHFGHLAAAQAMRSALDFAKIFFVPAGQPWLKIGLPISAARHRLDMLRLAVSGERYLGISTVEVDRTGPSYAVDTIDILQRELGSEAKLSFLLGSDALLDLPQWKDPSRLIQICQLVAFSRPGFAVPSLDGLEAAIAGISRHITFVEVPQIDISASEIRRLVALGASIGHLVPQAVEMYIIKNGLYRS